MNAVTQYQSTALAVNSASSYALLMDQGSLERLERIADMMFTGRTTVPQHLRGSKGDCFAVVLQSMQWGMNPFAVAQKTHLSQSGALGYEAQLISAALSGSGALKEDPEYEFIGDWSKVLGKVEERKSDKGGKYYVATYTKQDEVGLGVICRATLKGESKPRELEVMLSQCYPRFSTQWATDPKQQICYVAVRKWGRLHKPGVLLGVYTPEELEQSGEKFMGMAEDLTPAAPATPQSAYTPEAFAQLLPSWRAAIAARKATPEGVIGKIKTKGTMTAEQEAAIRAPIEQPAPPPAQQAEPVTDVQPKGEPQVMLEKTVGDQLHAAATLDALYEAADLIGAVADPEARARLTQFFEERQFALESE